MLREILFKAKRKDNCELVEGYPFPSVAGKELNRMTVFESFPGGTVVNTYDVDKETVCQYTGKNDKNGIEIFEGDKVNVCLNPEIKTGVVRYNAEFACFCIDFDYGFTTFLDFEIANKKVGEKVWIEVIRNIHDKED